MDQTAKKKFCPFRSIIPTSQAKLGHAMTGMSERDCDGVHCQLWVNTGSDADCVLVLIGKALMQQGGQQV